MQKKSREQACILEEVALRSYLRGDSLKGMGDESSFGHMCARLELFGPIRPCWNCGGKGAPNPRGGSGFVPATPTRYSRRLEVLRAYYTSHGQEPPDDLELWAPGEVIPCQKCQGYGWVPMSGWYETAGWPNRGMVSAFPRHEKMPTGRKVDDAAVAVSGRVARWLYAVFRENPLYVQVLIALCGEGNECGVKEPYLDVWELTDAGKKLSRSVEELGRLRVEIAGMTIPHPLAPLVRQAEVQATELVHRACNAWRSAIAATGEVQNGAA